ncbi:hypothetical protein [Kibdelosporangium aridum]|uniref:hypothetical protein n=1 Tax=Kibdelosporangium aridum TaxID=2030 RepID=UPI0005270F58
MQELFTTTVSHLGYRDAYFMWPQDAKARFRALVRASTQQDPEWTARFLRWLRAETPMRYAALVGAAQFVGERRAGDVHGMSRQVVRSVLRSADDPGLLLGYWLATYGARVPKPVKRGIADALQAGVTEPVDATVPRFLRLRAQTGKRGQPKPLAMRHVVALTHPKAVVSRKPESRGTVPDLLSSLKRFDRSGIPFEQAMKIAARISDRTEIRESAVGPLRFLTAERAVRTQRWPLAIGAQHSMANVPRLPGRTLIVIGEESVEEVFFGLALAQSCESSDVYGPDGKPFHLMADESPLHALIRWQTASFSLSALAATDILRASFAGHDRLVEVKSQAFGYRRAASDQPWLEFRGLCDDLFMAIPLIEAVRDGRWPWERGTEPR